MPIPTRLHSAAAVAAVTAGAGLLGTAIGGVAAVDSDLRAVTGDRSVQTRFVDQRTTTREWIEDGSRRDCPGRSSVQAPEV